MNNPVIHFEIGCSDQEATTNFYQRCFSWEVKNTPNSNEIINNKKPGIPGHITSAVTEIEHYILFYIQVEDVQQSLDKIEKEGGKTIVPAIELPNGKTFAWFKDVAGNTLGLTT
jgi:predicted enzyme related to lactoylglutathione lyase